MKKLAAVAALALVAACADAEPEADIADETAVSDVATAEPAAVMAADGQPAPGRYRITRTDGTVFMEDVKADGTYVQTDEAGAVTETGVWEQQAPDRYCYIVDEPYREEGDTGAQVCNTEGIDAEGTWTSTDPDGRTATVERVTA